MFGIKLEIRSKQKKISVILSPTRNLLAHGAKFPSGGLFTEYIRSVLHMIRNVSIQESDALFPVTRRFFLEPDVQTEYMGGSFGQTPGNSLFH